MSYLELDEAQRAEWAKREKEKKERTKVPRLAYYQNAAYKCCYLFSFFFF